MDKQKLLDQIAREIKSCRICKIGKLGKAVAGEGNPNAKIVFIGEAPGRQEALTGRPFVGRSGQLLTKLLSSIQITRKDVYITSPVKYFPVISQKGRAPTDAEINHGKIHLEEQLEIIDPKIIVLLGRVAAKGVLGQSIAVATTHGKVIKRKGKSYFVTYHPAAAVRFQKNKALIEEDFQKLKTIILSHNS